MAQVKTYRNLRDNLRVGGDLRMRGDFVPEASDWKNLRSYLNTDRLEEIFVDEEVLKKWESDRKKKAKGEPKSSSEKGTVKVPKSSTGKSKKRTVTKKKKVENNDTRLTEESV